MDVSVSDFKEFKLQVIRQGGLFLAYSHKLGVSTTGKSEAQAVSNFDALAQVFTRQTGKSAPEKLGALDDALLKKGWTKKRARWSPPVKKSA